MTIENRHTAHEDYNHAQTIRDINKTKTYTLIATDLLNNLLTNNNLNPGSIRLWQYLYNKARFNKHLSIRISYAEVAKELGKTIRTVIRYVNSLKENGYLLLSHNYNRNGQEVNTFYLRFPESLLAKVSQQKNRAEQSSNYNEVMTKPIEIAIQTEVENNLEVSRLTATEANPYDLGTPIENHDIQNQDDQSVAKKVLLPEPDSAILPDNNRTSTDDVISVDKENDEQFIKSSIAKLEVEYHEYDKHLQKLYELKPRDKNESFQKYESINDMSAKMSTLSVLVMQQKTKLEKLIHDKSVMASRDNHVTQKESSYKENIIKNNVVTVFSSNLENQRTVNEFQRKRIACNLTKLGFYGISHINIQEEVIFAIEKDSLRYGKNREPLTINHAINIALKLLRENRWCTPSPLWQAKIQQSEKTAPTCYHESGTLNSLLVANH